MKILFAHRYDPAFPVGGAARFVFDLALNLRQAGGHEIACVTNRGQLMEDLMGKGIPVSEIPWPRTQTFGIVSRMGEIVKRFQPDVLHSHHRYLTFLADIALKKRVPVLHTEHALRHDKRLFFRSGTYVTAVSESVRENMIQYYRVPAEKVRAIPNAVRPQRPDKNRMQSLRKRNRCFQAAKKVFLFTGRYDEQKGHVYLIDAVAQMSSEERGKFHILLAGDGPLRGSIEAYIEKKAVREVFEVLGHTDDITEYLGMCDAFILPSLWEGMPLVVLEAYQAGKPVIATDIPGTREVVIHEKTGILVPPKDPPALAGALRDFLANPERFERMKPAIIERAAQFSYDTMRERYEEVYRKLSAG